MDKQIAVDPLKLRVLMNTRKLPGDPGSPPPILRSAYRAGASVVPPPRTARAAPLLTFAGVPTPAPAPFSRPLSQLAETRRRLGRYYGRLVCSTRPRQN
eukprot:4190687-Pyramimonas_sp.AAC.1